MLLGKSSTKMLEWDPVFVHHHPYNNITALSKHLRTIRHGT